MFKIFLICFMKKDEAKTLLAEMLVKAGFNLKSIEIEEMKEGENYINLVSETDLGTMIGRNGEFLAALQSVVRNIFRNQLITEENESVRLDVDSYRKKQEENVIEMAIKRAKFVEETGKSTILPPMSPFFRRLVHLHVKDKFPRLNTFSKGTGDYRAVCISAEAPANYLEKRSGDLYEDLDL